MGIQLFSNNAVAELAAQITAIQTSIVLATGQGALFNYPSGGDWELATLSDANNVEIVKITARTTDTLTVVRGQEGTTARIWLELTSIKGMVTKGTLNTFVKNYATGADALQLGTGASATGLNSIAVGKSSSSTGASTVAVGDSAVSIGDITVGIGKGVRVGQALPWTAATVIILHQVVKATATNDMYLCIAPGTTHATTQPTWNTTDGETTTDNTVTWVHLGSNPAASITLGIAIGNMAAAPDARGAAIGYSATTGYSGVAIGYQAGGLQSTVAVGVNAHAYSGDSIAVGEWAEITAGTGYGNTAFGVYSSVNGANSDSMAIGADAINRLGSSHVISTMNLIRKDNGENASNEHLYFTGNQAVVFSKIIDLKTLADDVSTITIPAGATFFVDEIGLIVIAASGVTGQPNVSFGVTGDTVSLLASTASTKSAAKGRDVFTPISKDGVNSLTASVKTAAIGTTLTARFYWKGMLVED